MSTTGGTPHEPRLARVAAMIADATRSRMLAFLLDGQYACAGELAVAASVQPSTASAHLNKLVRAGLVVCEPRGRHRYFRLADGEVAQALQALALVAERGTHECAWSRPGRQRLREARCCYGHLAGRLGVALWDALRREGRSRGAPHEVELTAIGRQWLAEALEFDASAVRPSVRLGYGCLDWSERRDHLAGALARQLLRHFIDRGWLRRETSPAGSHRVLELTPAGRRLLLPALGLLPALAVA